MSNRRVPAALIATLRELGVLALMAPTELGGAECDPLTFLKPVEASSSAAGFTTWNESSVCPPPPDPPHRVSRR